MHTIPHEPTSILSDVPRETISEDTPNENLIEEGEGVSNFWDQFEELAPETPPLSKSGSPNDGGDI